MSFSIASMSGTAAARRLPIPAIAAIAFLVSGCAQNVAAPAAALHQPEARVEIERSPRGTTQSNAPAAADIDSDASRDANAHAIGIAFRQTGVASYYGNRFHGRRTASGERYDMNALTAAHRTLPLGACVRVTALGNGRSVVVRINDRGPFVRGRVIDLSHAAADALGMHAAGNLQVTLERLTIARKVEPVRGC